MNVEKSDVHCTCKVSCLGHSGEENIESYKGSRLPFLRFCSKNSDRINDERYCYIIVPLII